MIFLSSIPRSGSTLLTSLLNQRGDCYATPTSNLCDIMGAVITTWDNSVLSHTQGTTTTELYKVLKGVMESRYNRDKLVIDKSRDWCDPNIIATMGHIQSDVKIIATVRPVADCLASFVKIAKPIDVADFCKNSEEAKHCMLSYNKLREGYEAYPDNFLLIEYENLVSNTQNELDRISEFLDIPVFIHDLANVPPSTENDKQWAIPNLHDVRPVVSKSNYSPSDILGSTLYNFYQGGEFWNDKPEPIRLVDDLDRQLETAIQGKLKKAEKLNNQLQLSRPNCDKVKFNAGWFEMRNGNLLSGHKLLEHGRKHNMFGSPCRSSQPRWDGQPGVVLMHMEGGTGDQIHGLRYAKEVSKTNRVIVACSADMAPIFAEHFPTVQHEATGGVYHDYYCPSMSAPIDLGLEYKDISGEAYMPCTSEAIPGRVGIRWQGNPEFTHDIHRKFPPELMFEAVRELPNPVSLQRDTDDVPDWMEKVDLSSWINTRDEISKCELVITSCTAIAHMAGAMGVTTWIVTPILPYYLWASPGDKSVYYDSVTLFRQTKYGKWQDPFEQIKQKLGAKQWLYTHKLQMVI